MRSTLTDLLCLPPLLLVLFFSASVQAHRFAPSLLKIDELGEGQYHLVWKTPTQGTSNLPLRPNLPESCEVQQASPVQVEGTGQVFTKKLQCSGLGEDGLVGDSLGVLGLGPNRASAVVMVNLRDGRQYQQVLTAKQPEFVIPAKSSANDVVEDYTLLGIEHILGGIDHLLFVFGLLLLVGVGSRLLWTITAFTLGHSITLSLVTLGVFEYPVALVEFTIALSIFVLAVELSRAARKGLFRRNPWWLTGGFGLLHGMGFAGALAETGLPQDNMPLALLFFNIGIEIGQIVFILTTMALWYMMQQPIAPWQDKLRWVPVYLLGSLSALWCIERGLESLA